jgi:putative transposase
LIQEYPTFGYRRIWAILKEREGMVVNRKTVYRILKVNRWLVHNRTKVPKLRVKGWRSVAEKINQRWAIDITHIPCGKDGWGHLVAVLDCHDSSCVGFEWGVPQFALRG